METPAKKYSNVYRCPHCSGAVDNRETVNSGRIWFCKECTFCSSFERYLKRIREDPVEEVIITARPELTEEEKKEGRRILLGIIPVM